MPMAEKKVSYVQVTLVVIVIIGLLVGIVPWLVGEYMDKFVKVRTVHNVAMFAKVSGNISEEKSGNTPVVVITNAAGKIYVLQGNNLDAVKKYKGKHLEVFGKITESKPVAIAINGKPVPVSFDIDVSKMSDKELAVGRPTTPEELAANKARYEDQKAFQEATLAKLHLKGQDVIKGKLSFAKYKNTKTGKDGMVVMLIDKYNIRHIVVGQPMLPIIKKPQLYKDNDLVLIGHDYDDRLPGVPEEPGVNTFRVRRACFDNLEEIRDLAKENK